LREKQRDGCPPQMPTAEYFRRQATTCLRLARICADLEIARRLLGMAAEYESKAIEIIAREYIGSIPHHDELLQRMVAAVPSLSREDADTALAMTWDKDKHQSDKEDWYRLAMEWATTYPQTRDED